MDTDFMIKIGRIILTRLIGLMIGVAAEMPYQVAAQVINIHVSTVSLEGVPFYNDPITLTAGWLGDRQYGTNNFPHLNLTKKSSITGEVIFSNILYGPYLLSWSDNQVQFWVPTNLTGTVDFTILSNTLPTILPPLNVGLGSGAVFTNPANMNGYVPYETNIWPGYFWAPAPSGGGGSGITALYATNNSIVSYTASLGFIPTNFDSLGAAAAALAAAEAYTLAGFQPISANLAQWSGVSTNAWWIAMTGYASATYQPIGSYLTGNQTITLSKDATGSGTTSIAVTVTNLTDATPGQVLPAMSAVNLTGLNGSQVTSGTVAAARLPVGSSIALGLLQGDGSTLYINGGGVESVVGVPLTALGASVVTNENETTGNGLTNNLSIVANILTGNIGQTNLPVVPEAIFAAPDWNNQGSHVQSLTTNAAFTMSAPVNAYAVTGDYNFAMVVITNSGSALFAISSPATWIVTGTPNCTNITKVLVDSFYGYWTNAIFTPLK